MSILRSHKSSKNNEMQTLQNTQPNLAKHHQIKIQMRKRLPTKKKEQHTGCKTIPKDKTLLPLKVTLTSQERPVCQSRFDLDQLQVISQGIIFSRTQYIPHRNCTCPLHPQQNINSVREGTFSNTSLLSKTVPGTQ